MIPVSESFETEAEGLKISVPDVEMERCSSCGLSLLTPVGSRHVSSYVAKATGALTGEELQHFLDKYELTQKEASKILNIGEKNFSRWLSGKQRVSGSMSNYIRTLTAHPDAFETLKRREWADPTRDRRFPAEHRAPDEEEKTILSSVDFRQLAKIGLVESTRKFDDRRTEICRLTKSRDLLEFQVQCSAALGGMAAFKDTNQKFSEINGGLWIQLAERAAHALPVAPYHREKLEKTAGEIRELTQHPPHEVFESIQRKLAEAGVAFVVIPKLDGSAYRGCTRLLHPAKAMIGHSLKYKNASQFWRVLFHEVAHLILHIETPDDYFAEYEEKSDDLREAEADEWADKILVFEEKAVAFEARHSKPTPHDLVRFSRTLKTSPAIVAEIMNSRAGDVDLFDYGWLRKEGLFPTISAEHAESMWTVSRDLIVGLP